MNRIQKNVMRRVYYIYTLRALTQPAVLHGFFMLGLLIALTYFVSLGNVIQNMLVVRQGGDLWVFLLRAFLNTEAWTLLLLGILIFSAFSLRFTLVPRPLMRLAKA